MRLAFALSTHIRYEHVLMKSSRRGFFPLEYEKLVANEVAENLNRRQRYILKQAKGIALPFVKHGN